MVSCPVTTKPQSDPDYRNIFGAARASAKAASFYFLPKKFDVTFTEGMKFADALKNYTSWLSKYNYLLSNFVQAPLESKQEVLSQIAATLESENRILWWNEFLGRIAVGLWKVANQKLGNNSNEFNQGKADDIATNMAKSSQNFIKLLKVADYKYYDNLMKGDDVAYQSIFGDNPNYANFKERWLRSLEFFAGKHATWKKLVHKVLAQIPAVLKVSMYSLWLVFFWSMWWLVLWWISLAWVLTNLDRLRNRRSSNVNEIAANDLREIEWLLWINYEWWWMNRMPALYDFVFHDGKIRWRGLFVSIWERIISVFMSWANGTGIIDMPSRPFYADHASRVAIDSLWNYELTYEENIQAIKWYLTDPNVRADIVNKIVTIAKNEAGMSLMWPWGLTTWGTAGILMNVLWSRWFNKATYYLRGIASWLHRNLWKRDMENNEVDATNTYMERFGWNADLWLTISVLGHWLLKAYRIAAMLEAWENDDEDEVYERFWEIFRASSIPIQAIQSSGLLRWYREWIEMMFAASGLSEEGKELTDYVNDFDPAIQYKAGTAMFAVQQINKLLYWARFYVDVLNSMHKAQKYWERDWVMGALDWMVNYSNRLYGYLNDDMYRLEEDWMLKTIGTSSILNIVFGTQSNPFKKDSMEMSQLRSFLLRYPLDPSEDSKVNRLALVYHGTAWKYVWLDGDIKNIWLPFVNAENQNTSIKEIISAIDNDWSLYNFVYNANADGLSMVEAEKWYHTFIKNRTTYRVELDPVTGQRVTKRNQNELKGIENVMKDIMGDKKFSEYTAAIEQLANAWLWKRDFENYWYMLETKAYLETALQWIEDWDARAEMLWQQFLAFTMQKHYDSLLKEAWYSFANNAPIDVQKMFRSETFKTYSDIARATDFQAFQDVVAFSVANRNPELQKYFSNLEGQDWKIEFNYDTTVQLSFGKKVMFSAHILWAKNISEGNPYWVIASDLINLKSAYLRAIEYDKENSEEQIKFIHDMSIVEWARIREMMTDSWVYTDNDVAALTASLYVNAPKAYAEFLADESIDSELRNGVAKQLYSTHIISMMSDIDSSIENPDQIVKDYLGEVGDYLQGGSGNSWYGSSKNYYKQIYSQFRPVYTNSLSNVFSDYERHVFKQNNYWWGYNWSEWNYIKARSRLNQTRTAYPVYDLWGVWASTGISQWTSPTGRRIKVKKLESVLTDDEPTGFDDTRWWEIKIKKSRNIVPE
jgi:hypothetical protein